MRCFLVCYDISCPKRWRSIFKIMKTYGEPWQYSVFFCRLRQIDRVRMENDLRLHLNNSEDRLLICDLGCDEGSALESITALGAQPLKSERISVL